GLTARGLMGQIAGVLSGYLGVADQAEVVAEAVAAVKAANRAALYLCDPVFGDEGGA
ncbi:MAG TPA: pyridoxal kinase, partial [Alphaproteobacteria bacterium]|nr:pyridoxal kinase [Alphaproteobacteria bacterium]